MHKSLSRDANSLSASSSVARTSEQDHARSSAPVANQSLVAAASAAVPVTPVVGITIEANQSPVAAACAGAPAVHAAASASAPVAPVVDDAPEANQSPAARSAAVPAVPAPAAGSSSTPPSAILSGLLFGQQSSALLKHYLAYNSTAAYLAAPQYGEPVFGLSQDMSSGMARGMSHGLVRGMTRGMAPASSQYQTYEDTPSLSSPAASAGSVRMAAGTGMSVRTAHSDGISRLSIHLNSVVDITIDHRGTDFVMPALGETILEVPSLRLLLDASSRLQDIQQLGMPSFTHDWSAPYFASSEPPYLPLCPSGPLSSVYPDCHLSLYDSSDMLITHSELLPFVLMGEQSARTCNYAVPDLCDFEGLAVCSQWHHSMLLPCAPEALSAHSLALSPTLPEPHSWLFSSLSVQKAGSTARAFNSMGQLSESSEAGFNDSNESAAPAVASPYQGAHSSPEVTLSASDSATAQSARDTTAHEPDDASVTYLDVSMAMLGGSGYDISSDYDSCGLCDSHPDFVNPQYQSYTSGAYYAEGAAASFAAADTLPDGLASALSPAPAQFPAQEASSLSAFQTQHHGPDASALQATSSPGSLAPSLAPATASSAAAATAASTAQSALSTPSPFSGVNAQQAVLAYIYAFNTDGSVKSVTPDYAHTASGHQGASAHSAPATDSAFAGYDKCNSAHTANTANTAAAGNLSSADSSNNACNTAAAGNLSSADSSNNACNTGTAGNSGSPGAAALAANTSTAAGTAANAQAQNPARPAKPSSRGAAAITSGITSGSTAPERTLSSNYSHALQAASQAGIADRPSGRKSASRKAARKAFTPDLTAFAHMGNLAHAAAWAGFTCSQAGGAQCQSSHTPNISAAPNALNGSQDSLSLSAEEGFGVLTSFAAPAPADSLSRAVSDLAAWASASVPGSAPAAKAASGSTEGPGSADPVQASASGTAGPSSLTSSEADAASASDSTAPVSESGPAAAPADASSISTAGPAYLTASDADAGSAADSAALCSKSDSTAAPAATSSISTACPSYLSASDVDAASAADSTAHASESFPAVALDVTSSIITGGSSASDANAASAADSAAPVSESGSTAATAATSSISTAGSATLTASDAEAASAAGSAVLDSESSPAAAHAATSSINTAGPAYLSASDADAALAAGSSARASESSPAAVPAATSSISTAGPSYLSASDADAASAADCAAMGSEYGPAAATAATSSISATGLTGPDTSVPASALHAFTASHAPSSMAAQSPASPASALLAPVSPAALMDSLESSYSLNSAAVEYGDSPAFTAALLGDYLQCRDYLSSYCRIGYVSQDSHTVPEKKTVYGGITRNVLKNTAQKEYVHARPEEHDFALRRQMDLAAVYRAFKPAVHDDDLALLAMPRHHWWGSVQAFELQLALGRYLCPEDMVLKDSLIGSHHVPLTIMARSGLMMLCDISSDTVDSLSDPHCKSNMAALFDHLSAAREALVESLSRHELISSHSDTRQWLTSRISLTLVLRNCEPAQLARRLKEQLSSAQTRCEQLQAELARLDAMADADSEAAPDCAVLNSDRSAQPDTADTADSAETSGARTQASSSADVTARTASAPASASSTSGSATSSFGPDSGSVLTASSFSSAAAAASSASAFASAILSTRQRRQALQQEYEHASVSLSFAQRCLEILRNLSTSNMCLVAMDAVTLAEYSTLMGRDPLVKVRLPEEQVCASWFNPGSVTAELAACKYSPVQSSLSASGVDHDSYQASAAHAGESQAVHAHAASASAVHSAHASSALSNTASGELTATETSVSVPSGSAAPGALTGFSDFTQGGEQNQHGQNASNSPSSGTGEHDGHDLHGQHSQYDHSRQHGDHGVYSNDAHNSHTAEHGEYSPNSQRSLRSQHLAFKNSSHSAPHVHAFDPAAAAAQAWFVDSAWPLSGSICTVSDRSNEASLAKTSSSGKGGAESGRARNGRTGRTGRSGAVKSGLEAWLEQQWRGGKTLWLNDDLTDNEDRCLGMELDHSTVLTVMPDAFDGKEAAGAARGGASAAGDCAACNTGSESSCAAGEASAVASGSARASASSIYATAASSTASAAAPAAASGHASIHSTPADTAASAATDAAHTVGAESGAARVSASSVEGAKTSAGSAAATAAASGQVYTHSTPSDTAASAASDAAHTVAAESGVARVSASSIAVEGANTSAGSAAANAAAAAASAPAADAASASAATSASAAASASAGVSAMAGLPLWQQQVLQAVRRINLSLGGKEHYSSFTSSQVRRSCKEQPVVMSHVSWLPLAPLHCDFSGQASVSSERSRSWLFNMLRVNREPAAPAQALLMSIMTATAVHDYRPLHGSVDIKVLRSAWMQQSFMAGRLTMAARMRLALPQLYRFACSEQLQLLHSRAQALALLNEARNHISCGPYEHMSAQAAVSAARRAGIESHNRSVAQGTARTMMTMGISQVQSDLARAALAHSIRQSVEFERATAIDGRLSAALSVRPDREAAAGVLRNQHFLPWIDQHVLRSTLSSMARTYSSTSWDTLVERQEHAARLARSHEHKRQTRREQQRLQAQERLQAARERRAASARARLEKIFAQAAQRMDERAAAQAAQEAARERAQAEAAAAAAAAASSAAAAAAQSAATPDFAHSSYQEGAAAQAASDSKSSSYSESNAAASAPAHGATSSASGASSAPAADSARASESFAYTHSAADEAGDIMASAQAATQAAAHTGSTAPGQGPAAPGSGLSTVSSYDFISAADGTDSPQGPASPLAGMDVFDDWDDYPESYDYSNQESDQDSAYDFFADPACPDHTAPGSTMAGNADVTSARACGTAPAPAQGSADSSHPAHSLNSHSGRDHSGQNSPAGDLYAQASGPAGFAAAADHAGAPGTAAGAAYAHGESDLRVQTAIGESDLAQISGILGSAAAAPARSAQAHATSSAAAGTSDFAAAGTSAFTASPDPMDSDTPVFLQGSAAAPGELAGVEPDWFFDSVSGDGHGTAAAPGGAMTGIASAGSDLVFDKAATAEIYPEPHSLVSSQGGQAFTPEGAGGTKGLQGSAQSLQGGDHAVDLAVHSAMAAVPASAQAAASSGPEAAAHGQDALSSALPDHAGADSSFDYRELDFLSAQVQLHLQPFDFDLDLSSSNDTAPGSHTAPGHAHDHGPALQSGPAQDDSWDLLSPDAGPAGQGAAAHPSMSEADAAVLAAQTALNIHKATAAMADPLAQDASSAASKPEAAAAGAHAQNNQAASSDLAGLSAAAEGALSAESAGHAVSAAHSGMNTHQSADSMAIQDDLAATSDMAGLSAAAQGAMSAVSAGHAVSASHSGMNTHQSAHSMAAQADHAAPSDVAGLSAAAEGALSAGSAGHAVSAAHSGMNTHQSADSMAVMADLAAPSDRAGLSAAAEGDLSAGSAGHAVSAAHSGMNTHQSADSMAIQAEGAAPSDMAALSAAAEGALSAESAGHAVSAAHSGMNTHQSADSIASQADLADHAAPSDMAGLSAAAEGALSAESAGHAVSAAHSGMNTHQSADSIASQADLADHAAPSDVAGLSAAAEGALSAESAGHAVSAAQSGMNTHQSADSMATQAEGTAPSGLDTHETAAAATAAADLAHDADLFAQGDQSATAAATAFSPSPVDQSAPDFLSDSHSASAVPELSDSEDYSALADDFGSLDDMRTWNMLSGNARNTAGSSRVRSLSADFDSWLPGSDGGTVSAFAGRGAGTGKAVSAAGSHGTGPSNLPAGSGQGPAGAYGAAASDPLALAGRQRSGSPAARAGESGPGAQSATVHGAQAFIPGSEGITDVASSAMDPWDFLSWMQPDDLEFNGADIQERRRLATKPVVSLARGRRRTRTTADTRSPADRSDAARGTSTAAQSPADSSGTAAGAAYRGYASGVTAAAGHEGAEAASDRPYAALGSNNSAYSSHGAHSSDNAYTAYGDHADYAAPGVYGAYGAPDAAGNYPGQSPADSAAGSAPWAGAQHGAGAGKSDPQGAGLAQGQHSWHEAYRHGGAGAADRTNAGTTALSSSAIPSNAAAPGNIDSSSSAASSYQGSDAIARWFAQADRLLGPDSANDSSAVSAAAGYAGGSAVAGSSSERSAAAGAAYGTGAGADPYFTGAGTAAAGHGIATYAGPAGAGQAGTGHDSGVGRTGHGGHGAHGYHAGHDVHADYDSHAGYPYSGAQGSAPAYAHDSIRPVGDKAIRVSTSHSLSNDPYFGAAFESADAPGGAGGADHAHGATLSGPFAQAASAAPGSGIYHDDDLALQPVRRGRGRPRKYPPQEKKVLPVILDENGNVVKRSRGRPRKQLPPGQHYASEDELIALYGPYWQEVLSGQAPATQSPPAVRPQDHMPAYMHNTRDASATAGMGFEHMLNPDGSAVQLYDEYSTAALSAHHEDLSAAASLGSAATGGQDRYSSHAGKGGQGGQGSAIRATSHSHGRDAAAAQGQSVPGDYYQTVYSGAQYYDHGRAPQAHKAKTAQESEHSQDAHSAHTAQSAMSEIEAQPATAQSALAARTGLSGEQAGAASAVGSVTAQGNSAQALAGQISRSGVQGQQQRNGANPATAQATAPTTERTPAGAAQSSHRAQSAHSAHGVHGRGSASAAASPVTAGAAAAVPSYLQGISPEDEPEDREQHQGRTGHQSVNTNSGQNKGGHHDQH